MRRKLPPLPSGFVDPEFRIGVDGRLLAMVSNFDLTHSQLRADWHPGQPQPPLPADAKNQVVALIGDDWGVVAEFDRDAYSYDFDVADDDWCIVATPRCRPGDLNATAFIGAKASESFCIGDGIQHLQCDTRQGFWVGYFDEGIFGNYGWGHGPNEPKPIGACGLRRFWRTGASALKYPGALGEIADCYALNVVQNVAWMCAYSEFPIEALAADGTYHHWTNEQISGATGLAVDGEHAALIGGYQDKHRRVALMTLNRGMATAGRMTTLQDLFPRVDLSRFRVLVRGASIHLVDQDDWLTLALSDIV